MKKVCTQCKQEKGIEEFWLRNEGKYRASWCKACAYAKHRAWVRENSEHVTRDNRIRCLQQYGLTDAEYVSAANKQGNVCKICGRENIRKGIKERLYVDHSHKTGAVRGLLCTRCNFALGHVGDDVELLEKMIRYLTDTSV